jgi:hypothetical protein
MSDPMSTEREVVIVASGEFVAKLDDLALSSDVWAVRTAATEEVTRRIWEERTPQETGPLTGGVTLFTGIGDAEHDLLSIIDTVELHHGIAGGEASAVNTVRVFGTGPTDAIRDAFGSLGFTRLVLITDGFVAYWSGDAIR